MEDSFKMDPKGIHRKGGKCIAVKWHKSNVYVQAGHRTSSETCRMARRPCSVFERLLQDTKPLISAKFITVVWIRSQILWPLTTHKLEGFVRGWVQTQTAVEKCEQVSVQTLTFAANWEFFFNFLQRNKLYRITSRYCDWANDRKIRLSSLGKLRNILFSKMSRLAFQTASYSVGTIVR